MKPYHRTAEYLNLHGDHQSHWAWLHLILQMGIALDVTTSGHNPVDDLVADLHSRVGNTSAVQTVAAELNYLRERIERGQA